MQDKLKMQEQEMNRQMYFANQRQQIEDFKQFKEQTEGMLHIRKGNKQMYPS